MNILGIIVVEWNNPLELPSMVKALLPCCKNGAHTICQQGVSLQLSAISPNLHTSHFHVYNM
jgi:hypothetical protein